MQLAHLAWNSGPNLCLGRLRVGHRTLSRFFMVLPLGSSDAPNNSVNRTQIPLRGLCAGYLGR